MNSGLRHTRKRMPSERRKWNPLQPWQRDRIAEQLTDPGLLYLARAQATKHCRIAGLDSSCREDVVQEILFGWIRYVGLHGFPDDDKVVRKFNGIAKWTTLDFCNNELFLKKRSLDDDRERDGGDFLPSDDRDFEQNEARLDAETLLSRLSAGHRTVLQFRFGEGMSYPQISKQVGHATSNVYNICQRYVA